MVLRNKITFWSATLTRKHQMRRYSKCKYEILWYLVPYCIYHLLKLSVTKLSGSMILKSHVYSQKHQMEKETLNTSQKKHEFSGFHNIDCLDYSNHYRMPQHRGPLSEKNRRFSVEVRHKNINNHGQQVKNKTHLCTSTHGDITVQGSVSCRI